MPVPRAGLSGSGRPALAHTRTRIRDSPGPTEPAPEAEWGLEPSLIEDIERIAERRGYRVRRTRYEGPDHRSPFDPWWTLRTGSVPFWMKFNMEKSRFPSIDEWRQVFRHARRRGESVGVDDEAFPMDYATFATYHTDIQKLPARYPIPGPLSLSELDRFIAEAGDEHPVEWLAHAQPRAA